MLTGLFYTYLIVTQIALALALKKKVLGNTLYFWIIIAPPLALIYLLLDGVFWKINRTTSKVHVMNAILLISLYVLLAAAMVFA